MAKKNLLGKLGRSALTVLNVIPDTVEIVSKVVDSTAPIVDKHLDRQHAKKSSLIPLPSMIDIDYQEAKNHLESLGFKVILLEAKAEKKWSKFRAYEIVDMQPRRGRFEPGTLVKLYYLTEESLQDLAKEVSLPNVRGMDVLEAKKELEALGYRVALSQAYPNKGLVSKRVNQVLSMDPKPNPLTTIKVGSLIKLTYLDKDSLDISRGLLEMDRAKKARKAQERADKISQSFRKIPFKK